jgi:FMN phosphatase YigB (HAD superfamily)
MSGAPIVFDLGNVLLTLRFDRFVERASDGSERSEDEIRQRYIEGERKRLFETGKISEVEFITELASWLGWPTSHLEELTHIWADVFDDMPGAEESIKELSESRSLWIMSDTNQTHWRHVRGKWPFLGRFDRYFTSYSTSKLKTDPAAFGPVIESIVGSPNNVFFFDDIATYVANARMAGLDAHLFEGWKDVMEKVRSAG